MKDQQRDDRGCHDLKVPQERGVGGRAVPDAQHQKDRRCDVQHDHADHIGQIRPAQLFGLPPVLPAQQGKQPHPDARAEVKQGCHDGRLGLLQQQLGAGNADGVKHSSQKSKNNWSQSVHSMEAPYAQIVLLEFVSRHGIILTIK